MKKLLAKIFALSNITMYFSHLGFFAGITLVSLQSGLIAIGLCKDPWVIDSQNVVVWGCSVGLVYVSFVLLYAGIKMSWEEDLGITLNKLVEQKKEKDDTARNSGEDKG